MSRNRKAGLALALAALSIGAMAFVAPVASAATGSVSGTVIDQATTNPIQGVEVCVFPKNFEGEEFKFEDFCTKTDANGQYTIASLEAGEEYLLEFWGRELNYVPQFFPEKDHLEEAEWVEAVSGALTGKNAQLKKGAGLSGRVTASVGGNAIQGVEVCAESTSAPTYVCDYTNASGDYVIGGMPAGSYKVEFWGGEQGFLFQFYNGVTEYGAATPVPITTGNVAEHIDAALDKGASISGTVVDAKTGSAVAEVLVCARYASTGEYANCALTGGNGAYSIGALFSGAYKVSFSEEPGPELTDGYDTQFYDGKATFAEATAITMTAPEAKAGVDARLHRTGETSPPQLEPKPAVTLPGPPVPASVCRKGFKKKRVRGKTHCVKVKKHHHRHRH